MAATLTALALGGALFLFATWKARQPKVDGELRWIPWGGVQFVALLVIVLTLAHVVTLLTGQPLIGRLTR